MILTTNEFVDSTVRTRRGLYLFLYYSWVDEQRYLSFDELSEFTGEKAPAALSFGMEMGHITRRGRFYRLTAQGMLFTEEHFREVGK